MAHPKHTLTLLSLAPNTHLHYYHSPQTHDWLAGAREHDRGRRGDGIRDVRFQRAAGGLWQLSGLVSGCGGCLVACGLLGLFWRSQGSFAGALSRA